MTWRFLWKMFISCGSDNPLEWRKNDEKTTAIIRVFLDI